MESVMKHHQKANWGGIILTFVAVVDEAIIWLGGAGGGVEELAQPPGHGGKVLNESITGLHVRN